MKKRIFILLEEVKQFLKSHKVLRDSDDRLMANIWAKYIGHIEFLTAKDVLSMLSKSELPSYESISRCRRKLQEEFPELRGEKWLERHNKTSKDVKAEIKQVSSAINQMKKAKYKRMEIKTPYPAGFEYKRSTND